MKRRKFITGISAATMSLPFIGCTSGNKKDADSESNIPSFLKGYDQLFQENPSAATLAWFKEARFGLFLHYGLYSIPGRGEWVQLTETIPVAEYAKLMDQFTADNFDADFITELAVSAGMKYINITSRHHDSFCLFRTAQTDFNSMNAPAGRDLVEELAKACERKGLGLFLYYSYALDWKHPYFYSREAGMKGEVKWSAARPDYQTPQPEYQFSGEEDFTRYIDFIHNQVKEILTQYPNLAGIWLDPIMGYYSRPDLFPIEETYQLIRKLQPQALIAFKQGANGDEDFVTNPKSTSERG